ncbi:hypothetical protein CAPTEDRAFT_209868 [Capitella teleta]|uniref:Uncharacterized protein n=1 Tax=Capitella teleta TaxID=283909 RepID=R7UWW4_CAPTE|nr:hypothetical protein CAPTEDRAFT_209868 [Capitella teleta]|eukprot:ELU07901.1 hypothetical protein CAPTEDRAFT_209868 [Capitella teleta]
MSKEDGMFWLPCKPSHGLWLWFSMNLRHHDPKVLSLYGGLECGRRQNGIDNAVELAQECADAVKCLISRLPSKVKHYPGRQLQQSLNFECGSCIFTEAAAMANVYPPSDSDDAPLLREPSSGAIRQDGDDELLSDHSVEKILPRDDQEAPPPQVVVLPPPTTGAFNEGMRRKIITIIILTAINLVNYMDRFSIAGLCLGLREFILTLIETTWINKSLNMILAEHEEVATQFNGDLLRLFQ